MEPSMVLPQQTSLSPRIREQSWVEHRCIPRFLRGPPAGKLPAAFGLVRWMAILGTCFVLASVVNAQFDCQERILTGTLTPRRDADGNLNLYGGLPYNSSMNSTLIPIRLGLLGTFNSWQTAYLHARVSGGAMTAAVLKVNSLPDLLPGYNLSYTFSDTMGCKLISIDELIQQWTDGVVAFFGPDQACVTEATIAAALKLPMISNKCTSFEVSDKNKFPTFARTVPTNTQVTLAVIQLLRHFNWSTASVVFSTRDEDESLAENLLTRMEMNSITVSHYEQYEANYWKRYFLDDDDERLLKIVKKTYEETRIYIFLGQNYELYHFCEALDELGLLENGEYVIVHIPTESNLPGYEGDPYTRHFTPEVSGYYRNVLILWHTTPNEKIALKVKDEIVMHLQEPPYNLNLTGRNLERIRINEAAYFLYDAVMLYAYGLNATLSKGGNITDGKAIIDEIIERGTYQSVMGMQRVINPRGDAVTNVSVFVLTLNESVGDFFYTFNIAGNFQFNESNYETLLSLKLLQDIEINWVAGSVPPDRPRCGFKHELCKPPVAVLTPFEIAAITLGSLFLIIAVIGGIFYRLTKT